MRLSLPDSSKHTVHSLKQWGILIGSLSALALSSGCSGALDQTPSLNSSTDSSERVIRSSYAMIEELFQTEVINLGLETLGYESTASTEIEPDVAHQAISRGSLDFTAVHWNPLHKDFFEENGGDENFEQVSTLIGNALQGYLIDKATATEHNIDSLDDLKDPEIAKLFDTDGNGKANLVGCLPGWGCHAVVESHLDGLDLRNTVDHDQNYHALIKETIKRYNEGKPVLYYTWTPYWLSSILVPGEDVVWLDVPAGDNQETVSSVDGKNLGFEVNQIEILANRVFLQDHPDIARWFELVEIPIQDVNLQNQRIQDGENTPEDIRRHAEEWVSDNQGLFDSWIEEAKQSANK